MTEHSTQIFCVPVQYKIKIDLNEDTLEWKHLVHIQHVQCTMYNIELWLVVGSYVRARSIWETHAASVSVLG